MRGRAIVVAAEDPTVEWYRAATEGMWKGRFHLFRIDVESVAVVRYAGGEQSVQVPRAATEFRRRYG